MREWRKHARFNRPGSTLPRRLPASVTVSPRSLTGNEVVEDLFIKQITVTQRDTNSADHAATFLSAGSSYNGTLSRWMKRDEDDVITVTTSVDNDGHIVLHDYMGGEALDEDPDTPGEGQLFWYVKTGADGVSSMYFIDDAGVVFDLKSLYTESTQVRRLLEGVWVELGQLAENLGVPLGNE